MSMSTSIRFSVSMLLRTSGETRRSSTTEAGALTDRLSREKWLERFLDGVRQFCQSAALTQHLLKSGVGASSFSACLACVR